MNRHQSQKLETDVILIEGFDDVYDSKFINEQMIPYLKDVFNDLSVRNQHGAVDPTKIDKVIFFEYCNLPGIINDRFLKIFETQFLGYVTEESFYSNMVKVYVSELEVKMRMTFDMYDFNQDGFINKEDIRIVLSYIPFRKGIIDIEKGKEQLVQENKHIFFNQQGKEGLYLPDEGRNIQYKDRITDQQDIKQFLDKIFGSRQKISYEEYEYINNRVSSEMFYSLMSILHEKLPCSMNFIRLKKMFRLQIKIGDLRKSQSPTRVIASPTILKKIINKLESGEKKLQSQKSFLSPLAMQGEFFQNRKRNQFQTLSMKSSFVVVKSDQGQEPAIQNFDEEQKDEGVPTVELVDDISSPRLSKGAVQVNSKKKQFQYKDIPLPQGLVSNTNTNSKSSLAKLKIPNKIVNVNNQISDGSSPLTPSKAIAVRVFNLKTINTMIDNTKEEKKQVVRKAISRGKNNSSNSKQILWNNQIINPEKTNYQSMGQFQSPIQHNGKTIIPTSPQPTKQVLDFFCLDDNKKNKATHKEGECYLKTKNDVFQKHWISIKGNELYVYKNQNEPQHRLMHCLVGTFISEMQEEHISNSKKSLFPVKIFMPPNKSRILFFTSPKEQQAWFQVLKETIGYSNLFDYYEVDKSIAKGQFGLVKLAVHKKTRQYVAIKTVKKKDLKPVEIYQQRREIEILKMCQHPNIIKLIDLFENADYYYIVLEYIEGKDLYDYLQSKNYALPEERVKVIAFQIAQAMKYLHSYGIVHRDLKLENIMMTECSDRGIPKIVDFGLAKIMGPNEKSQDPFGTVGYVAPEVLKKEPYGFNCDMWSFGCLIYALICGSLPFDGQSPRSTIKMTLLEKLEFELPVWNKVSFTVKDLLINLLKKDPLERLTLDKTINHPWFNSIIKHSL